MKSPRLRRSLLPCVALVLGLVLAGACSTPEYASVKERPDEAVVQLRCATLPQPLTVLAIHYWFVAYDPQERRWHRWEVWQTADVSFARGHWGHVHKDLQGPNSGVGGGEFWIDREWRGEEASRLLATLARCPETYPHRDSYWAWPGPNSNTYAAWILREAGVAADLHPKAVGKDYLGLVGAGFTTTRTGVQLETPLVGLKLGARDGIELHVLCLTLGLDAWPPALKTPFGRLGFPE